MESNDWNGINFDTNSDSNSVSRDIEKANRGDSKGISSWWFFGISGLPLIFGYLHL